MTASSLRRAIVIALATMAVVLAMWWGRSQHESPIGIVLVTLDTTRADRLSPYGLMDVSMPALDRLAREGIVFDQATSVAPLTLPSHTSMFTGLFPPAHGVRDNGDRGLADKYTTLAEVLWSQGFRTGAFVGSVVLDADRGLAQGFDTYRNAVSLVDAGGHARQRRGDEVVTDAAAWLDQLGNSRFFLWAHLYDPHRPYDPPEPYRSRFGDAYVAEIAFADAQIGRLLDALDERGLSDRTIVVVAGDHGESLGEHGERDHGIFIYESVLRVPFMIRAPGVAPARSAAVVRLVDLMPTVLDLLGVSAPRMDGVSLTRLMKGEVSDLHLEAFAESQYPLRFGWSSLGALREGRFKVIHAPRPELYDLAVDPFEESNIYATRQPLADAMIRRLQALTNEFESSNPVHDGRADVPPEVAERLSALGYVGTARVERPRDGASLPDPKDCLREDQFEPFPRAPGPCARAPR